MDIGINVVEFEYKFHCEQSRIPRLMCGTKKNAPFRIIITEIFKYGARVAGTYHRDAMFN